MTCVWMEDGGDATGGANAAIEKWWYTTTYQAGGGPSTEQARTGSYSIKCTSGASGAATILYSATGIVGNAGRCSFGIYLANLPTNNLMIWQLRTSGGLEVFRLRITSAGVLQCFTSTSSQIGSNGTTLSTGQWYRLCVAWSISTTSSYTIKIWLDGAVSPDISGTNTPTLARTGGYTLGFGWMTASVGNSLALYLDDFYADDDSSCNDTGDIHIVCKRPNKLGAQNEFDNLVGSSVQRWSCVAEFPMSGTNYWQCQSASQLKENFGIQGPDDGAVPIGGNTLVARCAWVGAWQSSAGGTPALTDNGADYAVTLPGAVATFYHLTTTADYPTDAAVVGLVSTGAAPDTALVECGVMFAILGAPTPAPVTDTYSGRGIGRGLHRGIGR